MFLFVLFQTWFDKLSRTLTPSNPFYRKCIVTERTHFVLRWLARWERESRDKIFKQLLYKACKG